MQKTTLVIEVAGTLSGVLDQTQLISTLRCLGLVRDERLVEVKIILGSLAELMEFARSPRTTRYKGKQKEVNEWKRAIRALEASEAATADLAATGAVFAAEGTGR